MVKLIKRQQQFNHRKFDVRYNNPPYILMGHLTLHFIHIRTHNECMDTVQRMHGQRHM